MKLAEALQERADLNKKIEELRNRIENCVLVQEGEEAGEDPAALLVELDDAVARLEILMAAINLTNSRTKVNGKSLTQIIARKDEVMENAKQKKDSETKAAKAAKAAASGDNDDVNADMSEFGSDSDIIADADENFDEFTPAD